MENITKEIARGATLTIDADLSNPFPDGTAFRVKLRKGDVEIGICNTNLSQIIEQLDSALKIYSL